MNKQKLFQYAVIWNPTESQEKDGKKAKLLVEPTNILAKDQASLATRVAMEIPKEYIDQLDQVDIVIRPF